MNKKPHSPETRAKQSVSMKASHARRRKEKREAEQPPSKLPLLPDGFSEKEVGIKVTRPAEPGIPSSSRFQREAILAVQRMMDEGWDVRIDGDEIVVSWEFRGRSTTNPRGGLTQ